MSFPPQFLDEIRARVPVSDVVGRRVKLRRQGREHSGLCPFHNEKTPSFTVSDEKGFYHCFGCGAHGDVIEFMVRTEGLAFPEAVEKLAAEAGLVVPKSSPEDIRKAERAKTLYDANEAACRFFERELAGSAGREARDHLAGRRLSEATLRNFRLGFAPDGRDRLKTHLLAAGFEEGQLVEAGLLVRPEDGERVSYDRFRNRVIFPITDRRGRIVAFGGRVLGDGKPKYLNSPETPLFHKGRQLYALDKARAGAAEGRPVVVGEGYTDVIALHQAGFTGAVAPLGTALTESQIAELWKLAGEPILCFDGDEAGRRAAARAAERALPILEPGRSLSFALLPPGEDPDSMLRAGGIAAMQAVLDRARPLVDLVWEMEVAGRPADTPERRAAIRKALRGRAAVIAERTVQQSYLDEFDARLEKAFGRPRRDGGRFGSAGRGSRIAGSTPWARGGPGGSGGQSRPGGGYEPADTGLRADGDVGVLALRREQALLAVPVNHPALLEEISEALGRMTLSGELDRLRQALLAAWRPGLETEEFRNHLSTLGLSPVLDRVLSRGVYEFAPFARPETDAVVALEAWRVLDAARRRQEALDTDIGAARQDMEAELTERTWARYDALVRERLDADGSGDASS